MNLARIVDVALPELPAQRYRETYFRFNPKTIARVHHEPDRTIVSALAPGARMIMNFTPNQWELVKLFDGRRSYEQLVVWWRRTCGVQSSVEYVRKLAEELDEVNFWHKTAREESIALMEDLRQRRKKRRDKPTDISKMYLVTFDPDHILTRFYKATKWLYSSWFVTLSVLAMVWMVGVWIVRSDQVWRDSLAYWSMSDKGLLDVVEFYAIFLVVGFFHESGHALTVKHFGADVRRMGILTIYTVPAFFVDMSQVWLYHSRRERCLTTLAGFWVELTMCAFATLLWSGTPPGSFAHDFAYKFILVGGIMPVLVNMNPLIRLDGYNFCVEFFRLPRLKEKSTAFFSAWVRKNLFGMPATVPYLPRRRAAFYGVYAFLSGLYSYFFLLFLARMTYRIFLRITPEWAFLPAGLIALRIFKSRIEKLMKFLKALYLDKRELLQAHRGRLITVGAAAAVLLFAPLRRESIEAPFVVEPMRRAIVRAEVPGRVERVLVREGQQVSAGAPLVRLRNVDLETEAANVTAELRLASARATQAELRYADYGVAEGERRHWAERAQILRDRIRHVSATSPISGTLVTPRIEDLLGSWVTEGSTVAEVQDLSVMRARVFVSEPDMRTLGEIREQSLLVDSQIMPLNGKLLSVSPAAQEVEPGLLPATAYQGMKPPPHYVAIVLLPNADGRLRSGMTGEAKIFGKRHSLAVLLLRPFADFIGRKVW